MNIVINNPYRVLGVYANSPKKDIVANKGKATAFLKVNRSVEYPLDLKGILPSLSRTLEMMNEAESHLAIAKEQIKYAQFWFVKMTPPDDVAFNHLIAGNIASAEEIWSKQESLSSLQNKMVCFLIEDKPRAAVMAAEKLYEKFGDTYINKVNANCTLQLSSPDLLYQFLNTLGEEIGFPKLIGLVSSEEAKNYIRSKTIDPLISKISSEVDKTKKVDHKDPKARIEAAKILVTNTREPFTQLKSILLSTDSQFQIISDKLGLEILQCGIDYYNNSDDDDAPHTAMKMQKYAQSVVVGTLARQRCDENVKILQKVIEQLPPQEIIREDRAIKRELEKYIELPVKIINAITLLKQTKPHLQSIKQKLGVKNKNYISLSTLVVNNALHNVIEEVNEAQNEKNTGTLNYCLREAWKAILLMDEFDIDAKTKKNRYLPNRNTLKELCESLLPPEGTETYQNSIEYAIKNFKGGIRTRYSSQYIDHLYDVDPIFGSYGRESNVSKALNDVLTLLKDTKQPLLRIKEKTSSTNDFYLQQSTNVVSLALNRIISIINAYQSNPLFSIDINTGRGDEFKNGLRTCWAAIELMDDMDVSADFAQHYRSNRATLRKICVNLGVINEFDGIGDGCAVTLFAILTTTIMSIYCIITIL